MFHLYVSAVKPCSGRPLPGTANLQMAIIDRFDRSMDFGIYNCRPLTTNAKVPSIHSDGRAGDTGFPVYLGQPHAQGFELVEILRAHAWELGIMGIIWDRRRWDFRTPWGRTYTGPNPHIDHVHWEQIPLTAVSLTIDAAYRLIGEPPMAFTPEEEKALKAFAPYASWLAEFGKEMLKPGSTTGIAATPQSLMHVLEVHRLVAEDAGVPGTDHLAIKARLLGQ